MIVAAEKPDAPPAAITVEVDERWMGEWIAYGFVEMGVSLANHADFEQYCTTHPRPKEQ
jgi:hypothetical protein